MLEVSRGWKCLGAGLVLTCLRAGHVSGPEMSQGLTCPDLSQGRKCLRAGLVSWFAARDVQGRNCLAAGNVQKFRAGSVSRPDLVRGRTSLGAQKPIMR